MSGIVMRRLREQLRFDKAFLDACGIASDARYAFVSPDQVKAMLQTERKIRKQAEADAVLEAGGVEMFWRNCPDCGAYLGNWRLRKTKVLDADPFVVICARGNTLGLSEHSGKTACSQSYMPWVETREMWQSRQRYNRKQRRELGRQRDIWREQCRQFDTDFLNACGIRLFALDSRHKGNLDDL